MELIARLKAAFVHLLVTAVIATAVAGVVFGIWFPGAFSDMVGGRQLFLLVLACDFALGPLISLVIYNRRKPRAELVRDYAIVGAVQILMLVYGVSVVVDSRPVYVVFVTDRLEVVTAAELDDSLLGQAEEPRYRMRSWAGPQLVSVERPEELAERTQILFSALHGIDIQLMPKYYRNYEKALPQILQRSLPIEVLKTREPEHATAISGAVQDIGREEDRLRWLPVRHRFGFWVVLIDDKSGKPLRYLPIDPYG